MHVCKFLEIDLPTRFTPKCSRRLCRTGLVDCFSHFYFMIFFPVLCKRGKLNTTSVSGSILSVPRHRKREMEKTSQFRHQNRLKGFFEVLPEKKEVNVSFSRRCHSHPDPQSVITFSSLRGRK